MPPFQLMLHRDACFAARDRGRSDAPAGCSATAAATVHRPRRRLHADRFVRPLVVERLLEAVERLLLRPDRRSRRRRRLGLQRLVETLVPAILVGTAGLDEHRSHAKAHEPDAEPRESAKAAGA
jgi:hypothetical protein